MAYTTAEARQQLLDTVAEAIGSIGLALAALGAAYELLDEHKGDELEERLFRPAQTAYGRAQRIHAAFAERAGLPGRAFAQPAVPGEDARAAIDRAVHAIVRAGAEIADLQDSMLPVEVGDRELRAGLAEVRELLEPLQGRARELLRTLGR